jgi:hypothetical protein
MFLLRWALAPKDVEAGMKTLVSILVTLIATSMMPVTPLAAAVSDITGKWTSGKSPVPVELTLESSGTRLIGTVRLGSGPAVDIRDGRIDGKRVVFIAIVPDGDGEYPMRFSGRRSGSRIDFKCDVDVNVPGEKLEFGPACLARISVRRAAH